MREKMLPVVNAGVCVLLGGLGAYLCVRWLLPWLLPFLLALAAAALIEPQVRRLCRRGMRRELAAGLCVLTALALTALLLWLPLHRGVDELREMLGGLPALLQSVSDTLEQWEGALLRRASGTWAVWLEGGMDSLREKLSELPALLSGKIPGLLSDIAAGAPDTLLFLVTLVIGFYFISASYPALQQWAAGLIPARFLSRARTVRQGLHRTLGRWLRAQLIMTGITFGELTAAFLLLRVDYALILALVIALIDALPVLGTGAVLIPWAVYDLLVGARAQAIGIAVTYAAVTVLRSCIQAKLLGDQLGLHPLATLVAIYVGWRSCGVWGMLLFPILAITAKQLWESGVLRPGRPAQD